MKTKILKLSSTVLFVLAAAWIVPPALQRARHLCPVRPDGVAESRAIPAFARKYGVSCSQCHTAYPLLNAYGRQFKENGFVRERGSQEGVLQSGDKELWTEKVFPWSLIVRSRPYDNGRGSVSNAGSNMGSAPDASNNNPAGSNGFKFQPLDDVDMFFGGGDAAKHVSFFGEMDAHAAATNGFAIGGGDFSVGYHPSTHLNFILARRGFFAMDPYQTIFGNESPTIANRGVDGAMPDQGGLSGNTIGEQTQTVEVYGRVSSENSGSLYYAAAVTGSNNGSGASDDLGKKSKNGAARLAYDTDKGLMIGAFGTFGHEEPATVFGTGNNSVVVTPAAGRSYYNSVTRFEFVKTGIDMLVELGDFTGRGVLMYSRDNASRYNAVGDPFGINPYNPMTDRAAYVEAMYNYKRGGHDYPFLLPLVRDNWYTTTGGRRSFNYLTFHLAHYFRPNFKVFTEYSVDTKTDVQGTPTDLYTGAAAPANITGGMERVGRGNRASVQFEVGF